MDKRILDALLLNRRIGYALVAVGVVLTAGALGVFAVDTADSSPDPVSFEETASIGLAHEERLELDHRNGSVPRVQVFYSQYEFIAGYYGVEQAIEAFDRPGHDQQFGFPVAVYVSDYSTVDSELSPEGYLQHDGEPDWTDATEAHFVVGSDAATPAGETIVPFGAESAAQAFVDRHGGVIRDWEAVQSASVDTDEITVARDQVDQLDARATDHVTALRPLADRPVSTVVGDDAPTVQDAVDAAPPNTTVVVPPGTYEETVEIEQPITLRGENATIRGNGTDSVIEVNHDNVGVVGLTITGIGDETQRTEPEEAGWDERIENGYGHGDAGVRVTDTEAAYVADLTIETPSNGVLVRDADAVVERISVTGTERWQDGFMGVMAMRSYVVVQNSTFEGGRDGVYTHRAHESVIRDNRFLDHRFGTHLMFTSDTLIADNVARGQDIAGITIMTDSTRNAVVGNDIRDARDGIIPTGTMSYFGENVVANTERGIMMSASQSVYERNVLYENEIGLWASSVRPSNRVVLNDFVGNDQHAVADRGPLQLWTHDGDGNYWGEHVSDGWGDKSYSPTDRVTGQLHTQSGTTTLAASPVLTAIDAVRDTTPGMRRGEVVDTAPRSDPVHPAIVDELKSELTQSERSGQTEETNER